MPYYEVVAVSRTQAQSAAPTFAELGRITITGGEGHSSSGSGLSWSRELYGDGYITASTDPLKIPSAVASRLVDLAQYPIELALYRDGVLVQRGPLVAWQVQGKTLVLYARGLAYYARYMALTVDKTYSGTDQALIVKDLIDHHQAKDYGNFGLVTSGITSHGVTRTRTYKAAELININNEMRELAEADNGFDITVNPSTRAVVLTNPTKGTDKSTSVILDVRGIVDASMSTSLAAGQFGSGAFLAGVVSGKSAITSESVDATVRSTFGLAYVTHTAIGLETTGDLDAIANRSRDVAKLPVFQPNKEFFTVTGTTVDDFDTGDTITYEYNPGFGYMTYSGRVKNIFVSVTTGGQDRLTVEFV